MTVKKLRRFRAIKLGYYSFLALVLLLVVSAGGELLVSSRALVVSYQGELFFPTYSAFHPGSQFGEDYSYEADYRTLRQSLPRQARAIGC